MGTVERRLEILTLMPWRGRRPAIPRHSEWPVCVCMRVRLSKGSVNVVVSTVSHRAAIADGRYIPYYVPLLGLELGLWLVLGLGYYIIRYITAVGDRGPVRNSTSAESGYSHSGVRVNVYFGYSHSGRDRARSRSHTGNKVQLSSILLYTVVLTQRDLSIR